MPSGTVRVIAALLLIVSLSLNTNVHNSNNQFAPLFVQGAAAAAAATNRSHCGATVPMPFSTNLTLADVSSTSSSTLFTIGCVAQSPAVSWGVSKDEGGTSSSSNFAAAEHRTPVVLTEISYSSSSTTVHMWDSEKLQWMDDHTTTIPNKIARSVLPFVEAVTDPSTNKTVVNFFVLMLNELHGVLSLHTNDRPHFALTVPGNFPDVKYDARTFGSGMAFMAYSNALSGVFVADTANRCLRYVQVFEVLPEPVNRTSPALRSTFSTSPAQIVDVTNAGVCSGSTTPPTTGGKEVRLVAPTALAVANAHDASQGVFLWDYSVRTLYRVLSPNLRRTRGISGLDFSNTRLYEVTSLAATTGGADTMQMPYCSVCNTPGRFSSIDDRLVLSHTEFGYLSRLQLIVKDSGLPLGVNRSDCQGVRDTGVLCIMVSSPGEVQQLTVPESTEAVQSAASGGSPPLTGSHGNIFSHGWWSVVKDVSEGACVWNTYEMTPVEDCPILSAQFITARAGDGSKPPASRMWNDSFPVSLLLRNNSANQIAANPSSGSSSSELIPSEVYTTNLTNCANATVSFDGDENPSTPTPTQVAAGTEFCCVMPLMGSPPIKINLDGGTDIVAVDYVKDYYSEFVDFSSEGVFVYVQQPVGPEMETTYRMQRYNFSTMVNKVAVNKNPSMMATQTKITSIGAGMPSEPLRGYGSAGGIYAFSFDSLTPSAAPIIGSANGTFGLPPLFGGQWVSLFSQHEYQTFLVDRANHCLRLVVGRTISTIAGVCGTPGSNDGVGSAARFENPYAITGWPSSSVAYIADDNGIRAVTAGGTHTGSDFSVATIWRSPTFKLTSGLDIRSIGIVTDIPHLTFALGSPCALRFANVSASENSDKLYLLRQYKCCALRAIVPGRGFLGAESTALFASIIMGYQAQGTEALVETWHASSARAQVILAGDYCPVTTPPSTSTPDTLLPDTPSPPQDSETPSDATMPTTDSLVPTSPPPEDTNSAQHEDPTTTSDEPPNTTTLIVALSCVGVVVVIAIAVLFAWHFRKQKDATEEDEDKSRGDRRAVSGGKLSKYAVSNGGRDGATTFNDDGQEMESVDTAPALSHSQMATRGNFTTLGDTHSPQLTLNDGSTAEDEQRDARRGGSPSSRNNRRATPSLATPTDNTSEELLQQRDVDDNDGLVVSQRGANHRESSGSTPLMTTVSRSQLNTFDAKAGSDDTLNGSNIEQQSKMKNSANYSSLGAGGDMNNSSTNNNSSRMIGTSSAAAANHNVSDRDAIACIEDGSYIKVQLIGRGGYGSVYSCLLNNGSLVAMKEMLLPHGLDREASFIEDVEVEMNIVSSLHHPNVIRYYGCRLEEAESKLLLFMELVSGGSLAALTRKTSDPLPEEVAKRYLQQVLEGLHHVHQCGAVHRDLKCDNVLLTTDGVCKLCDFGTSKVMSNTTGGATMAAQTMIGTPLFMAPEMLLDTTTLSGSFDEEDETVEGRCTKKQDGYTKKADIWSFGILALELLNKGQPPWPSFVNQGAAFLHIASEKGKPRVPARLSDTCKAFIARATERNPALRATAAELLQDPWLSASNSTSADNYGRNTEDALRAAVTAVVDVT